jgi:hypothetical protein
MGEAGCQIYGGVGLGGPVAVMSRRPKFASPRAQ